MGLQGGLLLNGAWAIQAGTGQRDEQPRGVVMPPEQPPQKGHQGLPLHRSDGIGPAPWRGIEPVEPVSVLVMVLGEQATMAGCWSSVHHEGGGDPPSPHGSRDGELPTPSRDQSCLGLHHHLPLIDATHLNLVDRAAVVG